MARQQIAGITDPSPKPRVSDLQIADDDIRETIEADQLKQMKARGSDLTIFSRAPASWPTTSATSSVSDVAAIVEPCFCVSRLFPDHFVPAAMLPQSPGVAPETWIPSCKVVEQYGAVAINLNPDPSGGHWTSPPLTERHWYPITSRWSTTTSRR